MFTKLGHSSGLDSHWGEILVLPDTGQKSIHISVNALQLGTGVCPGGGGGGPTG
jgi:hypothetical protein